MAPLRANSGTVKPKIFVIENVPELLTSGEFVTLRRTVKKFGYELEFGVLNAANYGVPQSRRRAIIIGSRIGTPALPSEIDERRTVRDAIGDLPLLPNGETTLHRPRKPLATRSSVTNASHREVTASTSRSCVRISRRPVGNERRPAASTFWSHGMGQACPDHSDRVFQAGKGTISAPGSASPDHASRSGAAPNLPRRICLCRFERSNRQANRQRRSRRARPTHRRKSPGASCPTGASTPLDDCTHSV